VEKILWHSRPWNSTGHSSNTFIWGKSIPWDRLCGLVVKVSGYRYRGPGLDPRRYQIFWVVVGLEREVKLRSYLNKKSSGFRFRKQRLTAVGTRCANYVTPLYPQKLALTSPTGGGRSVGMVRSRTKATEFSLVLSPFHGTIIHDLRVCVCSTGTVQFLCMSLLRLPLLLLFHKQPRTTRPGLLASHISVCCA